MQVGAVAVGVTVKPPVFVVKVTLFMVETMQPLASVAVIEYAPLPNPVIDEPVPVFVFPLFVQLNPLILLLEDKEILPSFPAQDGLFITFAFKIKVGTGATVALMMLVQLFAIVTVIEYVPPTRLLIVEPVPEPINAPFCQSKLLTVLLVVVNKILPKTVAHCGFITEELIVNGVAAWI